MDRYQSATIDLMLLFGGVFLAQQALGFVGYGQGWFALAAPVERPWTLVTSVYAHSTVEHLVVNALALLLVGIPLERFATRFRFHAFVLITGMLAGLAEVAAGLLMGTTVAVVGASGAILALYGYALAGNPLTGGFLSRLDLSRKATAAIVLVLAGLITLLTSGPGIAVIAHVTGFILGLVGGRKRVLKS